MEIKGRKTVARYRKEDQGEKREQPSPAPTGVPAESGLGAPAT
jgi:hypothetical protein